MLLRINCLKLLMNIDNAFKNHQWSIIVRTTLNNRYLKRFLYFPGYCLTKHYWTEPNKATNQEFFTYKSDTILIIKRLKFFSFIDKCLFVLYFYRYQFQFIFYFLHGYIVQYKNLYLIPFVVNFFLLISHLNLVNVSYIIVEI